MVELEFLFGEEEDLIAGVLVFEGIRVSYQWGLVEDLSLVLR